MDIPLHRSELFSCFLLSASGAPSKLLAPLTHPQPASHLPFSTNSKSRLVDEHNNDIGDIDILSGCSKQKKVFVIETKRYRRALNPYQIGEEMEKVFSNEKTSMLNKHKRRFLWVKDNRNLLSLFFPTFDDSWEIIPLMVTSSLLISCPFAGIKENIISAKELTPDYLLKLK